MSETSNRCSGVEARPVHATLVAANQWTCFAAPLESLELRWLSKGRGPVVGASPPLVDSPQLRSVQSREASEALDPSHAALLRPSFRRCFRSTVRLCHVLRNCSSRATLPHSRRPGIPASRRLAFPRHCDVSPCCNATTASARIGYHRLSRIAIPAGNSGDSSTANGRRATSPRTDSAAK